MNIEDFSLELSKKTNQMGIKLSKEQIQKLYIYMNLLLDWNEKINLTAITEPNEVILKHFVDSLSIQQYIKKDLKMIDVGTGAGFPGIPISILNSNTEIILLDSLNKRINFLNEVVNTLNLDNVKTIHSRVEDAGKEENHREIYDIATSRAVASLNVLLEYLLPLVKVGGKCICMKGSSVKEEIEEAKNAIKILGGEIEKIDEIILPDSDIKRNIIIIKKVKETPLKYPRKAGIPTKEPI